MLEKSLKILERRQGKLGIANDNDVTGDPGQAAALVRQAQSLHRQQLLHDAERKYRAALALDPTHFDALHYLGIALLQKGRSEEALDFLHKALAQNAESAELHSKLAAAYCFLDRGEGALPHFARCMALRPDHAPTLDRYVQTLLAARRPQDAIDVLRDAIARAPNLAHAHYLLANVLHSLGRGEEAASAIDVALALDPANGLHYHLRAEIKSFAPGDPQIAAMEVLARSGSHPSPDARVALHFALARAYRDCAEFERASAMLSEANRLARREIAYDEPLALARFALTREIFTPELMRAKAGLGAASMAPVFILGMPRSGTSLTEQILASHPQVSGAGESRALVETVQNLIPDFPTAMPGVTEETLQEIAHRYVSRLEVLAGPSERIADKTLTNAFLAGLAHLALPQARFIHVVRDPIDTCLSCFDMKFSDGLSFAYDLGELGRYYRAYEDLMAHWEQLFAPEAILRLRYEDLVADPESQTRRLLAHCGLEWDEACLSFSNTDRLVWTASAAQVRRPLYKTSVGRRRPDAASLKPLLDALGSHATAIG